MNSYLPVIYKLPFSVFLVQAIKLSKELFAVNASAV
jgi:hypothetical protein